VADREDRASGSNERSGEEAVRRNAKAVRSGGDAMVDDRPDGTAALHGEARPIRQIETEARNASFGLSFELAAEAGNAALSRECRRPAPVTDPPARRPSGPAPAAAET